jgi:hypothetical protein
MKTVNDQTPAGLGHNNPPLPEQISQARVELPEQVTVYLNEHYRDRLDQVTELLDRARDIPKVIEDDATMGEAAKIIKDLRDLGRALDTARETEKAPYFRSSQSADNFFFGLIDKIARRVTANRPGAADVLQQRVNDWNQRKLAAEREARRQVEEAARREAEEAARQAAVAAATAEEDRLAAERARKPETQAAKEAVADLSETNAAAARAEAGIAADKAQEARVATFAKAADIVRHRVEDGPTVTMATESYAVVTDFDALDAAVLWPFVDNAAKEKALRAWAKVHNFNKAMSGAEVGRRQKTVVR